MLNSPDATTSIPAAPIVAQSSLAPRANARSDRVAPVANGPLSLDVEEMDRIEVPLGAISGYVVANGQMQPLPIGSTLQDGVFYWQLAPVFLGEYDMVFQRPDGTPIHLRVVVHPKTYSGGLQQAVQ